MGILIRRRIESGSALPTRCSLYCHTVALPSETIFFFMIIVYKCILYAIFCYICLTYCFKLNITSVHPLTEISTLCIANSEDPYRSPHICGVRSRFTFALVAKCDAIIVRVLKYLGMRFPKYYLSRPA